MINFLKKPSSTTSFIRIAKRDKIVWWQKVLMYFAAIFLALALGAVFIAAIGNNPFDFYGKILTGCFENKIYLRGLIRLIAPLLITSLGISVAFKMRFWNIGAEGQFLMGALMAATVAVALQDKLPNSVTLIFVIISGMVGAGLYGLITAVLKIKWGTNETLMTLMLNYIALYLVTYMKNVDYYRVPGRRPDFLPLPKASWLTEVSLGSMTVDIAIFVGLILVLIAWLYFRFTKQGYEISVIGDSINTAKYAGMNVKKVIMRTMFISSAVIGLAGALHVTGSTTSHTLSEGITGGVGWTAIIVAWLAKLNPFAILIVSFLLGILDKGSSVAASSFGTSAAVSDVLQGIILFTVLAIDFFINYRVIFKKLSRKTKSENTVAEINESVDLDVSVDVGERGDV